MSALRDNKVLIHNVYKYIRNRGMAHIRIGGKSNSVPIVSFDFSKSGKVKFYSSSGYIIDKTISDIEIKDLYSAIVTEKMFDSVKISKNEFNYEQFTLIIGK